MDSIFQVIVLLLPPLLLSCVDGSPGSVRPDPDFTTVTEILGISESPPGPVDESSPFTLIRDFFAMREVQFVTLFACSHLETLALIRALQSPQRTMRWASGVPNANLGEEDDADLAKERGVYVNLTCEEGRRAFETGSVRSFGRSTWFAWSPSSVTVDALHSLSLDVGSDLTVMRGRPDASGAELLDVHKVGPGGALRQRAVGWWRSDVGVRLWPRSHALAGRGDLQGLQFQAAVVLHQIAVGDDQDSLRRALVDHGNTHLDTETRFGFALATHLAEMYNFTLKLQVTPSWGYPQANGSFDGMIGMLQRGEIQFGITPAVITKDRLRVVDFTVQTWQLRTSFIFRHPRLLVPYKALVEPFAATTWLGVVLVAAMTAIVLGAVRHAEDTEGGGAGVGGALTEATLVVVGLLSQQGCVVDSRLVSGRTVLLSGLLLSVMLQSFYTSAIVTSLLTPIPRTIRTAGDLMRSPLKVGLEDYSYNRAVFPRSADPLTSKLYHEKILPAWPSGPEGGFFPVADGIQRVRRGGFAFYSEDSSLYTPIQNTFSDDEKCSLSEVELNPAFITAASLTKRSPYKELFNRGLLLMLERGLRARQRRQWSAQRPSCERETSTVAAVSLDPIFPAHALLLLGHVMAVTVLVMECQAWWRRSKGKNSKASSNCSKNFSGKKVK